MHAPAKIDLLLRTYLYYTIICIEKYLIACFLLVIALTNLENKQIKQGQYLFQHKSIVESSGTLLNYIPYFFFIIYLYIFRKIYFPADFNDIASIILTQRDGCNSFCIL